MKGDKSNELQKLIGKTLKEMEENKIVLLLREDILTEDYHGSLYKVTSQEIKLAYECLREGDDMKEVIRYLTNNVFLKYRTFFYDLFETNRFPTLFDLFEFE